MLQRRAEWLALAGYFATALIFLLPLPLHWATHIPGDNGDSYLNFWPFWYFAHLSETGGSLFHHHLQLYPYGVQLIYMTASPLGGLLMTPVTLLISPAAGLNTWLFLHLWLGGWFFYRFCRLLPCAPLAAWLGGFMYQWSPFVAVHITGHYTLAQVAWPAAAVWAPSAE